MTVQDFIKYYKNGHGKAICALQNITDKEPYRKAFFECLKAPRGCFKTGEYILNIAKILINKETEKEFIELLLGICKNEYPETIHFPTGLLLVLLEYLPKDEVVNFVENEYSTALKGYMELPCDSEDNSTSLRYHSLVVAVNNLLGDNDDRVKSIMQDCGKIFEIRKWFDHNPLLHLRFNHHKDQDHFEKLFKDALKDSPVFDELCKLTIFDRVNPSDPAPRLFKTAQDYIEYYACDMEEAVMNFCNADAEIVRQVAEIAVSENEEQSGIAFSYFEQSVESGCPMFPLESKRLIDIIEKYKNLYSPENPSSTVEANWSTHAMGVLAQIKGKEEKEYCISIAKDESLHWILRTRAIGTFIVNHDSSDGDLIRELYHSVTKMSVLWVLWVLAKQGIKDAPYELCIDAYENTNSLVRTSAAETLSMAGLLTDEMIDECLYDECTNIRDIASDLLKKEIK